ncbi:MAG: histone deacetylase [Acidobacteria bacterium]|nr:histone deacetylase [Acidobacteriota bacterium]MBI3658721.1 histone deacetylase [Acidobacteriota bacterium]
MNKASATPERAGQNPDPLRRLGCVADHALLDHHTGQGHPEAAARLEAIYSVLQSDRLRGRWLPIAPRMATPEEILRVHTLRHFRQVEQTAGQDRTHLDADTVTSARSYEVARLAAGAVLESIDFVFGGHCARAFDFIRPPGHHAEPDRAMGFCLFNNVAIGAAYALHHYGLRRILLVDFDVHHGNGTQAAFYDSPEVLFTSAHQFPLYPGTGRSEECGRNGGKGFTLNFPLPAGTDDATYTHLFRSVIEPVAEQYRPELVMVSAGFDAYVDDPLSDMRVTAAGFQTMTRSLARMAEAHSAGKIIFVLEGGYHRQGLCDATLSVLTELLGEEDHQELVWPLHERAARLIETAKRHVSAFWRV